MYFSQIVAWYKARLRAIEMLGSLFLTMQTYTGNILIAVNPFQRLPHLYDSHMMAQYKGAAFGELSPHPFAFADAAYRHVCVQFDDFLLPFMIYYGGYFVDTGL